MHRDREVRRLLRWCFPRITAVWLAEIFAFIFRTSFVHSGGVSESLAARLLPGARDRREDNAELDLWVDAKTSSGDGREATEEARIGENVGG